MIKNVAFIGLGVMGFPLAGHLNNKNDNLNINLYKRNIKKSENWISKFYGILSKNTDQTAENSDIVFMCIGRK